MTNERYEAFKCLQCGAVDVPLNGNTEPRFGTKCQTGLRPGEQHRWEKRWFKSNQQATNSTAEAGSTEDAV